MSEVHPGDTAYVCYAVPSRRGVKDLYHERLCLSCVTGADWVVLTPDVDMYVETLDATVNDDVTKVWFKLRGAMPPALKGANVYAFPSSMTAKEKEGWLAQGRVLAEAEQVRRGIRRVPLTGGEPEDEAVGLDDVVVPSDPRADQALRGSGGDLPASARSGVETPRGASGLDALRDALGRAEKPVKAAVEDDGGDVRTLPLRYDKNGERYREFRDGVERCDPTTFTDFPVRGPRTTAWVLRFMTENGGTPMGRHAKFRSEAKVTNACPGVATHESLCKILQTALVYDQVDASNLACMELVVREIQMIEEKYAEKMEGEEGHRAEAHLFLGSSSSRGNVCVDPSLRSWIAEEMRGEAAVLKERRKAREERMLTRSPGGHDEKPPGKKGK